MLDKEFGEFLSGWQATTGYEVGLFREEVYNGPYDCVAIAVREVYYKIHGDVIPWLAACKRPRGFPGRGFIFSHLEQLLV